jgi:hypothetical protein
MILSAILTSMWRVAMSAPVTVVRQQDSWSQVAGNMGLLDLGNSLTYRRPPDPIRSLNEEVRAKNEDGYHEFDESVLAALPEFGKLKYLDAVQTCIPCNVAQAYGFGPVSLLSANAPSPLDLAVIDSGASLTVSPVRSDFVSFIPTGGRVMEGVAGGCEIAGTG